MAKKKSAKPAKKSAARKSGKKAAKKPAALGRPTVGIDEDLDLFFKEDYAARNVFQFLLARTVRDLEQWSPEEIVKKLSAPIRQTVHAIRLRLAQHNRCLKGDEEFALEHQAEK